MGGRSWKGNGEAGEKFPPLDARNVLPEAFALPQEEQKEINMPLLRAYLNHSKWTNKGLIYRSLGLRFFNTGSTPSGIKDFRKELQDPYKSDAEKISRLIEIAKKRLANPPLNQRSGM